MASVWCLPNLTVSVNEIDNHGVHYPVPSNQIGVASPTWTKHGISVNRSTRFAIGLAFDLNAQPKSHILIGDYVEVGLQFDGITVAHRRIPVGDIVGLGGRYVFDVFVDGATGALRAAEIRPIERAAVKSTDEDDEDTLLRAQRLGKIEVTVAHGKGVFVGHAHDQASALPNNGTLPVEVASRIKASHYIHYSMPCTPLQPSVAPQFVDTTLIGEIGYFEFCYGSMEALFQVDERLRVDPVVAAHPFDPRNNGLISSGARNAPKLMPGAYPPAEFSAPKHTQRNYSLDADNINISTHSAAVANGCNVSEAKHDLAKSPIFRITSTRYCHGMNDSSRSAKSYMRPGPVRAEHTAVSSPLVHNEWLYAPDVMHHAANYSLLCPQSLVIDRHQTAIDNDVDFGSTASPADHPLARAALLADSRGLGSVDH